LSKSGNLLKLNLFLNHHTIKKYTFFWALIWGPGILALAAQSPSDSILMIRKIALQAVSVEADFQGQIYVITRFNELIKMNDTGGIIRQYSNNYLGTLQLISIHNPFQIVLFYPGFQTLIILDKSLNELQRITMSQLNIPYVTTLGYSPERELWFFDDQLKRFKKVNIYGRHILESNLDNIYQPGRVYKIRAQKNEVKVWCDSSHLITMDLNGNLKDLAIQAGEWIYWKDQITGFFLNQQLVTRNAANYQTVLQSVFPVVSPGMQGLTILEKGYASIDQAGVLYIFRKTPKL